MSSGKKIRDWVLKFPDGNFVETFNSFDMISKEIRSTPNLDDAQLFSCKRAKRWSKRTTGLDENNQIVYLTPAKIKISHGKKVLCELDEEDII